jgi:hypothetical protein
MVEATTIRLVVNREERSLRRVRKSSASNVTVSVLRILRASNIIYVQTQAADQLNDRLHCEPSGMLSWLDRCMRPANLTSDDVSKNSDLKVKESTFYAKN